jgi:RNA polymerase sigma factor (sigma-70 family)
VSEDHDARHTDRSVEQVYASVRPLLLHLVMGRFRIPECDAEALTQEVFLAYLQCGTRIENVQAWLVAAACNASRYYLRTQRRTAPLPADEEQLPITADCSAEVNRRLTVRALLRSLPDKQRQAVRLRYLEQMTYLEVAAALHTSERYATKLVTVSLVKLKRWVGRHGPGY